MILTTSGYFATGSSAAFNLLKEYKCNTAGELDSHDYENVVFYTPDGLFDLEDKLLVGNSIHRSDEAIKKFLARMKVLNDNDFVWMGGYRKRFGGQFQKVYETFAESLIDFKLDGHWQGHYEGFCYTPRRVLGSIKNKVLGKEDFYDFGKTVVYNSAPTLLYSYPKPEEYYERAKIFVKEYCEMILGDEKKNLVMNHAILPHHLWRIPNYFSEEFRTIVVERDPRDVYILVRYKEPNGQRIPTEVGDFVKFWRKLRENEKWCDDRRIVRVKLEDMIYRYDETIAFIEKRCGLVSKDHKDAQSMFNAEYSKRYTRTFEESDIWKDEIKFIEEQLPEYIYDYSEI